MAAAFGYSTCRVLHPKELRSTLFALGKYYRDIANDCLKVTSTRHIYLQSALYSSKLHFGTCAKTIRRDHLKVPSASSGGFYSFSTGGTQQEEGNTNVKQANPDDDFFGLDQEGNFDNFEKSELHVAHSDGGWNTKRRSRRRTMKNVVSRLTRHVDDRFAPEANDIVVGEAGLDSLQNLTQQKLNTSNVAESQNSEVSAESLAKQIRQRIRKEKSRAPKDRKLEEGEHDTVVDDIGVSSKGKMDSQGFRVLSHQVQDLRRLSPYVIAKILQSRIIYDHEDVLAIDKPYGLPSHGGPGISNNVNDTLRLLAKLVDKSLPKLYLVHRLDKETTGVMLLAKSEITARQLNALFRHHQVIKKYWVLTIHVPEPVEGVVDIPMAEGEVVGKKRMVLRPEFSLEYKNLNHLSSGKGVKAVTNYKVLASEGNCALVELQPETGIKHQIRCHLAVGLGCPILGDHKYSHNDRLAPQKVPGDMLQRLGMRQSKARTVPMHLHAKQLIIPEFRNGRNLFISATLPDHFTRNMRSLNIRL